MGNSLKKYDRNYQVQLEKEYKEAPLEKLDEKYAKIRQIVKIFCNKKKCDNYSDKKFGTEYIKNLNTFIAGFFTSDEAKSIDEYFLTGNIMQNKQRTGLNDREKIELEKKQNKQEIGLSTREKIGEKTPMMKTSQNLTEADARLILKNIQEKLKEMDNIEIMKIGNSNENIENDAKCLLNKYNNKMFSDINCTTYNENYNKLFDIKKEKTEDDIAYYYYLYNLSIKQISLLTQSTDIFMKYSIDEKNNILHGIQNFIIKTLNFLEKIMDNRQIINNNLLNSSNNLMYLLNHLTHYQVNLGTSIREIQSMYRQIQGLIKTNIDLFKKIIQEKNLKNLSKTIYLTEISDIEALKVKLTTKQKLLSDQHEQLSNKKTEMDKNIKDNKYILDNNDEELKKLATGLDNMFKEETKKNENTKNGIEKRNIEQNKTTEQKKENNPNGIEQNKENKKNENPKIGLEKTNTEQNKENKPNSREQNKKNELEKITTEQKKDNNKDASKNAAN